MFCVFQTTVQILWFVSVVDRDRNSRVGLESTLRESELTLVLIILID